MFARNLHDLLLAAPAGPRATLALDPGLRTGCKVAVVDATGKVLETATVYPHAPRNDWDGTLAILAKLCAKHRGGPDLDRQRHRQPRDRQAGRRPDQEAAGAQADQGDGLRGRRLGVLRLRAGRPRIPGHGRVAAWRGVHRPPPAGPAGRAGEDRPEIHRRRPVPARRVAAEAGALAGCGGRGLRERRRRGRQHRLRRPAGAHLRPQQHPGAEHRAVPRRQRRVQEPQRAEEGAAPGRQDLRAGRRLPPRDERRQPAGRLRRAPGDLPAGAAHRPGHRPRHPLADRRLQRSCAASIPSVSPTRASACRPSPTSSRNWTSPAATRARSSRPPSSRTASRASRTCSRA